MSSALERARELGFDLVALVESSMIPCRRELRDLCNPQSCNHYATSWSCPPGAGSFDQCAERISSKDEGVLVQTLRKDVDFDDAPLLEGIRSEHNAKLDRLAHEMRLAHGEALEFTTGGCSICNPCLYPDKPCAQPERQRLALSAYGVDVALLCERANMEYAFENGTIRFVGLVL